jgi:putative ABC transport system permease protein
MKWFVLSTHEWLRRPLRTAVTVAGVALAVAAVFSLLAFHDGYRDAMRNEIDRLGAHVLVVPKGCPYDATSIALHGANWPCYLKESYFTEVSRTPGVASAAPAFMAAMTSDDGTQVVYVGIDERMLRHKPAWKLEGVFPKASGEILAGAEAARRRKWRVGERVTLPELPGITATVSGVLGPTRGADDTFIYARLEDAQEWFKRPRQLTHILVTLDDPNLLEHAVTSLRGCEAGMDMNIVPLAHLFRTIRSLMNSTRFLLACVALIGLLVAAAGVSNAMLMSVSERKGELGVMRAIGASRADVFRLVCLEAIQMCITGALAGVLLSFVCSQQVEVWLRSRLPFSPSDALIRWDWKVAVACIGGAVLLGAVAALLPASRAARLSPVLAMREGSME